MSIWRVGKNETYNTVQEALDAISGVEGTSPFLDSHDVLITDSRVYPGFEIPDGMKPHPGKPLSIYPDTGKTPVISGLADPANSWIGIHIHGFADAVHIDDLTIRDFHTGVFYNGSSNNIAGGWLRRCKILNNVLYGVRYSSTGSLVIDNCSIQGGRYLVAGLRSRDVLIVHSSLYSTDPDGHCLWVDWQDEETGVTFEDLLGSNGTLFKVLNTIMVSKGAPPILVKRGLEAGLSMNDGNSFWSNIGAVASRYEYAAEQRVDTHVESMEEWRRLTGGDEHSRFVDPKYILSTVSGGPIEEQDLEPVTPIANVGVAIDTSTDLFWYSSNYSNVDRYGNTRQSSPTPGNIEVIVSDDYDYLPFLAVTSDFNMSQDQIYGVDRAVRQLELSAKAMYPAVRAGHFFVRDQAWYLYAEKMAENLQDLTWSKVTLDDEIEVENVYIGDVEVDWMRRGRTIWACHAGAVLSKPYAESVRVSGVQRVWNQSSLSFDEYNVSYELPVEEYPLEHYFPYSPKDGGPIVITDDTIVASSSRSVVPFEYSTEYDDGMDRTRLNLQGNENLFQNPHFHNSGVAWNAVDTVFNNTAHTPVVGSRYAHISSVPGTSESLSQTVFRRDTDKNMVLSFYMHAGSVGDHLVRVRTYYPDGTVFATQDFPFSAPNTSDDEWMRYALFLGVDETDTMREWGAPYDAFLGNANLGTVDGGSTPKVKVSLCSVGVATSDVDAMMISEGDYLQRYAGLPYGDEATVEWEDSESRLHRVRDLSIVPVVNPHATGFLEIGPLPSSVFDTSAPADSTTLTDDYAPMRTRVLPWAKIDGPNKYYGITGRVFGIEPTLLSREVSSSPVLPTSEAFICRPDPVVVGQSLSGPVTMALQDQYTNPLPYRNVSLELDAGARYPGMLGVRQLSSPTLLGTIITVPSDTAGRVVAEVIAPAIEDVRVYVAAGEAASPVTTFYDVNEENNGNIKIWDVRTGIAFDLLGAETSEYVPVVRDGSYSRGSLSGRPAFRTVSVGVRGTSDYDRPLGESVNPAHDDVSFYMDYVNRILSVPSGLGSTALVTYRPVLAWPSGSSIVLNASLLASLTSDIALDYDAKATLIATNGGLTKSFDVVYRAPESY